MLDKPIVRLVGRALVVFATTFLTALAASDNPTSEAVLSGAIVGAVLAALEFLTPLNKSVGVGSS